MSNSECIDPEVTTVLAVATTRSIFVADGDRKQEDSERRKLHG
ncbi:MULTISPECIES: hypothetical protein [unclassified Halorhabdus]|nr:MULTISPECIES: hypothetical protein [unclassified Halorhabdus]